MKLIILLALFFGFLGCAEVQRRTNEEYKSETSSYFAAPEDKLMITIEGKDSVESGLYINCNVSIGSLADAGSNNNSFKTTTPYARVLDYSKGTQIIRDAFTESQKKFNTLSEYEKNISRLDFLEFKSKVQMMSPHIVYICQNQGLGGLVGKIYFNGKEVVSDVANLDYAVVNLSYLIHVEDNLKHAVIAPDLIP